MPFTSAIHIADTSLSIGETSLVTFTFTVAVTGFDSADLTVGNGTLGAISSSDGGLTWTATFTPTVGVEEAGNLITLDNTGITGVGGPGVGTTNSSNYAIDTLAPTNTTASVAFSADTGTSGSDFITRTAGQTIAGTLASTLEIGETVQISTNNGASWVTAAATVGANSWVLAGVSLTQSDTLKIRVVDAADNAGTTYAQAYVLDTVAPSGISSVSLSADTGRSSSDFITKTAAQTISGGLASNLAVGHAVQVSIDNGATWSLATATVGANTWSLAGVALVQSDILKARVVDLAGNESVNYAQAYTLDTTAPAAPSPPDLDATSDTGTSNTDNFTIDATPTVNGTSQANASVSLYDTDGVTVLGTTTADGSGNWSITSSALATGQHTLSVKATDLAGNTSADSAGLTITIEPALPPPPPPPSVVNVVTPDGSLVTGDATDNLITWSGAGADTVSGGGGDDQLNAGPNNDVLQGNGGADTIAAGLGADIARGGQGNDFINGNQGNDLLFGDLGNDSVAGGQGADFVQGNQGDDVLLGDRGDDLLLGGQGNDILLGGDGADRLYGDLGDDTLTGGTGADTFSFIGGKGRDVIADFNHAESDHILLSTTQAADFKDLSGKMIADGADTVVTLGGLTIVLVGAPLSSLTAGDFIFS